MLRTLCSGIGVFLCVCAVVWLGGCTSGVETSPQPGIVRITLEGNPADTSFIIIVDTVSVSTGDSLNLTVFQGRVTGSDGRFATLFPTLTSYRQEDVVYNVLRRENDAYHRYVVFESYVPPQTYDAVQFGLSASALKFLFQPPIVIEPPLDTLRFVTFRGLNLTVSENRVTEVSLQIDPLKALTRFRDVYRMDFRNNVKILGVRNY
jgi:hypothetical protein